jgi:hypothetical protein
MVDDVRVNRSAIQNPAFFLAKLPRLRIRHAVFADCSLKS